MLKFLEDLKSLMSEKDRATILVMVVILGVGIYFIGKIIFWLFSFVFGIVFTIVSWILFFVLFVFLFSAVICIYYAVKEDKGDEGELNSESKDHSSSNDNAEEKPKS